MRVSARARDPVDEGGCARAHAHATLLTKGSHHLRPVRSDERVVLGNRYTPFLQKLTTCAWICPPTQPCPGEGPRRFYYWDMDRQYHESGSTQCRELGSMSSHKVCAQSQPHEKELESEQEHNPRRFRRHFATTHHSQKKNVGVCNVIEHPQLNCARGTP